MQPSSENHSRPLSGMTMAELAAVQDRLRPAMLDALAREVAPYTQVPITLRWRREDDTSGGDRLRCYWYELCDPASDVVISTYDSAELLDTGFADNELAFMAQMLGRDAPTDGDDDAYNALVDAFEAVCTPVFEKMADCCPYIDEDGDSVQVAAQTVIAPGPWKASVRLVFQGQVLLNDIGDLTQAHAVLTRDFGAVLGPVTTTNDAQIVDWDIPTHPDFFLDSVAPSDQAAP